MSNGSRRGLNLVLATMDRTRLPERAASGIGGMTVAVVVIGSLFDGVDTLPRARNIASTLLRPLEIFLVYLSARALSSRSPASLGFGRGGPDMLES